jgi:hypothetical protein
MAMRVASLLGLFVLAPASVWAQTEGCEPDAAGCARAPIAYRWREGLPREFDFDTDWVPRSSPVQVRIRAVLAGNTQVTASGELVASWPEPMSLRTVATPRAGTLAVDYGVQFFARLRLALPVGGTTLSWEGAIPYTPMIDFRAMSNTTFDPWAWRDVTTAGRTMRVRVADVPLTDALVRIPGISGGFSFEAAGEVQATYRSTRFEFGALADPITEMSLRTQAAFTIGDSVEYAPQLIGALGYTGIVHVYPSVYVSLAGRRWMLDLFDLPIPIGPFPREIRFDPSEARLELPDIVTDTETIDFGDVSEGSTTERTLEFRNTGLGEGRLMGAQTEVPFGIGSRMGALPARGRSSVLVSFAPTRVGRAERDVLVYTNDPDHPTLRVHLRGNGVARNVVVELPDAAVADVTDAAIPVAVENGGCGCHTRSSGRGVNVWAIVVALCLLWPRRMRHRH